MTASANNENPKAGNRSRSRSRSRGGGSGESNPSRSRSRSRGDGSELPESGTGDDEMTFMAAGHLRSARTCLVKLQDVAREWGPEDHVGFCRQAPLHVESAGEALERERIEGLAEVLQREGGRLREELQKAESAGAHMQVYFGAGGKPGNSPPCEETFGHINAFLCAFQTAWDE
ncbi:unnamed protein product, partial [Prorocentrum cordatum]